jgi:O-antigen/teichoic acid export membrane protein
MGQQTHSYKIFQNFSFLVAGRALGSLFVFCLFVMLSRSFGQEGIGQYSFAMGFTGLFAAVSEFGLYQYSVKELARESDGLGVRFGRIFSLRLLLSSASFVILLVIVYLLSFPRDFKLIILLIGAYQIMTRIVDGIAAAFIARDNTHLAGLIDAVVKAITSLAAITIVLENGSLILALATLPIITAAHLFIAYLICAKKYGRPKLMTSISSSMQLARSAMPYAQSQILFQVYSRTDIVLLGFLVSEAAAGIYNVAYRVIFVITIIPQFAAIALFPTASRFYKSSEEEFRKFYQKCVSSIILIGFPVAAGIWLTASDLVTLLFGEHFEESASVLRILAGLLFFTFMSRTLGVFLMSSDREAERNTCYWIVATVNLLGNLALIPLLGVLGAAIIALTSEALLATLFMVRLRHVVGWPKANSRLAISLIGVVVSCLPFTLLPPVPVLVVIPSAALLYAVILLLFKETRTNEVRIILSTLKRGTGSV